MALPPTTTQALLDDLDAEHLDLDGLVAALDEAGWGRLHTGRRVGRAGPGEPSGVLR